jgi:hypothetical protein
MEITRKADMKTVEGPSGIFHRQGHDHRTVPAARPVACRRRDRSFRAGRADRLAHSSGGPDADRDGGRRLDADRGGPKQEFYAGDVLWCPAEHKHWHGATPHEGMTHIAIQESVNGSPVTWMEKVTDEQYLAPLGRD